MPDPEMIVSLVGAIREVLQRGVAVCLFKLLD